MFLKFSKLVILLGVTISLAACTGGRSSSSNQNSTDSGNTGGTDTEEAEDVKMLKHLPGLVRQSQILPAFAKCLDLQTADLSTVTKDTYKSLKGNLSEEGSIKDLSGPLLMAVTQLAAEVCNDLITKESALSGSPEFLMGFDLSSDTATGSTDLAPAIDKITKSCWGRKILDLEKIYVIGSYHSTMLIDNRGKRGALFLCTALMSSPDTILY